MAHSDSAGSRREVYYWVVGTLLVVFLIFLFLGGDSDRSTGGSVSAPHLGTGTGAAPGFTLPDIDGRRVSLADLKGKVVVLNFWATWCPPCRREIPDFIALQGKYGAQGLQIVGIGTDEPEKVAAYARENGLNYTVLFGTDQVSLAYGGIDAIPTTFIINREGMIVTKYVGLRSREEFEREIRKLL